MIFDLCVIFVGFVWIVLFFFVLFGAPGLMKSFLTCIPGPHLERAARRTAKMAATARHRGSSSVRGGVTDGWSEVGAE